MSAPNAGLPPHLKAAELSEDQKYKNKFPGKKAPANTDFLRKRIQKGVKYFDSGDYNMAKSTNRTGSNPLLGKAIPTPEGVTQRKHSTASKSKLVDGAEKSPSPNDEKAFFEKMDEKENNAEEEEKQ